MKKIFLKIGLFFRWIYRFFVDFFKSLWRTILSLRTIKGIIALAVSLTIYYGWAVAMIVVGSIFPVYRWMIGVGTGVMLFWAGPFTPFWAITIVTTIFIQRYILRDKKARPFKDIYAEYTRDRQISKDDQRFMQRILGKEEKNKEVKKNDQNREPNDVL